MPATAPGIEASVAGLRRTATDALARGRPRDARTALATARALVHDNAAVPETIRRRLAARVDNDDAAALVACGRPRTALRFLERALALSLPDGDASTLAATLSNLVAVLDEVGDAPRAAALAEAAAALTRTEAPELAAAAQFNLAAQREGAYRRGGGAAARDAAADAYASARQLATGGQEGHDLRRRAGAALASLKAEAARSPRRPARSPRRSPHSPRTRSVRTT